MAELKEIKFENIVIPDVRVSSIHNEEEKALIASTTAAIGLVQDMVARPLPGGKYELISGKGRLCELKKQGHSGYVFKVLAADDKTALVMNITENLARGSYDYVSVSKSINKLLNMGMTLEELEKIFPWKKRWIKFLADLQQLPDDVMEALRGQVITPTHIQLALNLPTPAEVHMGLRTAIRLGWNSSTLKIFVDNRVQQIRRAHEEAQIQKREVLIPEVDAMQLIQYKQCLACGFQKPAQTVTVQVVCEHCMNMARYIAANFGSEKDAMDKVYNALQAYAGRVQPTARLDAKPQEVKDVPHPYNS